MLLLCTRCGFNREVDTAPKREKLVCPECSGGLRIEDEDASETSRSIWIVAITVGVFFLLGIAGCAGAVLLKLLGVV